MDVDVDENSAAFAEEMEISDSENDSSDNNDQENDNQDEAEAELEHEHEHEGENGAASPAAQVLNDDGGGVEPMDVDDGELGEFQELPVPDNDSDDSDEEDNDDSDEEDDDDSDEEDNDNKPQPTAAKAERRPKKNKRPRVVQVFPNGRAKFTAPMVMLNRRAWVALFNKGCVKWEKVRARSMARQTRLTNCRNERHRLPMSLHKWTLMRAWCLLRSTSFLRARRRRRLQLPLQPHRLRRNGPEQKMTMTRKTMTWATTTTRKRTMETTRAKLSRWNSSSGRRSFRNGTLCAARNRNWRSAFIARLEWTCVTCGRLSRCAASSKTARRTMR